MSIQTNNINTNLNWEVFGGLQMALALTAPWQAVESLKDRQIRIPNTLQRSSIFLPTWKRNLIWQLFLVAQNSLQKAYNYGFQQMHPLPIISRIEDPQLDTSLWQAVAQLSGNQPFKLMWPAVLSKQNSQISCQQSKRLSGSMIC